MAAAAAAGGDPSATSSASDAEADVLMPSTSRPPAGHHPALEAVNNATKWAVSAAAFTTLLARRDLLASWCVLGSVVAAVNCRVS